MAADKSDNFFEKVYDVVRLIPHGRVTSYGAIAKYLGAVRSARMVGWAMNACHDKRRNIPGCLKAEVVACHCCSDFPPE